MVNQFVVLVLVMVMKLMRHAQRIVMLLVNVLMVKLWTVMVQVNVGQNLG
jgi:hypothetical protein